MKMTRLQIHSIIMNSPSFVPPAAVYVSIRILILQPSSFLSSSESNPILSAPSIIRIIKPIRNIRLLILLIKPRHVLIRVIILHTLPRLLVAPPMHIKAVISPTPTGRQLRTRLNRSAIIRVAARGHFSRNGGLRLVIVARVGRRERKARAHVVAEVGLVVCGDVGFGAAVVVGGNCGCGGCGRGGGCSVAGDRGCRGTADAVDIPVGEVRGLGCEAEVDEGLVVDAACFGLCTLS